MNTERTFGVELSQAEWEVVVNHLLRESSQLYQRSKEHSEENRSVYSELLDYESFEIRSLGEKIELQVLGSVNRALQRY